MRMQCTITSVASHGAGAATETGEVVHLARHELSWDTGVADVVAIGDAVDVLLIGRTDDVLHGSLKRALSQDPWRDPERYQVGDVVYGEPLETAHERLALAHLPGGAVALIQGMTAAELPSGETVQLELVEVSHERRTIAARIAGATSSPADGT